MSNETNASHLAESMQDVVERLFGTEDEPLKTTATNPNCDEFVSTLRDIKSAIVAIMDAAGDARDTLDEAHISTEIHGKPRTPVTDELLKMCVKDVQESASKLEKLLEPVEDINQRILSLKYSLANPTPEKFDALIAGMDEALLQVIFEGEQTIKLIDEAELIAKDFDPFTTPLPDQIVALCVKKIPTYVHVFKQAVERVAIEKQHYTALMNVVKAREATATAPEQKDMSTTNLTNADISELEAMSTDKENLAPMAVFYGAVLSYIDPHAVLKGYRAAAAAGALRNISSDFRERSVQKILLARGVPQEQIVDFSLAAHSECLDE